MVAVANETVRLLNDWIEHNRPEVTDEYGREPLISSEQGCTIKGNIRKLIDRLTRPCSTEKECPCGMKGEFASKCEHSVSPHALRRGSITAHLREEVPKQMISDRANVSPDVLDKHYNEMTQEEQMEQRRQYLDTI